MKKIIPIITDGSSKPLGTYSQAIKSGKMVFISGQSPFIPETNKMISGGAEEHLRQSFKNICATANAAGGDSSRIVKVTLYLTSLSNFAIANKVMGEFFNEPYPSRSTLEVSALPGGAEAEIDAIMML